MKGQRCGGSDLGRALTDGARLLRRCKRTIVDVHALELRTSSLFLILVTPGDAVSLELRAHLSDRLSSCATIRTSEVPVSDAPWLELMWDDVLLLTISLRDISPEAAKEEIEKQLSKLLAGLDKEASFRGLANYGLFIPRTGEIACRSFAHGSGHYYRYLLAKFKLDPAPAALSEFLLRLLDGCPDDYFRAGPRASSLEMLIDGPVRKVVGHEMSKRATEGLLVRKFRSAHEDLEKYLLDRDPETIACEVPIWFEPGEWRSCDLPGARSEGTLTGHIDVLRCERDGRIGIWDYKPSAEREERAHVQVYLYALMLSVRTMLPLERFLCGYFDSEVAYSFFASDAHCALR